MRPERVMGKAGIVIVGGESLLARELADVFSRQAPGLGVKLVGAETDSAILTERNGEAAVIRALETDTLRNADVVLLAGAPEASRETLELLKGASPAPVLIDLSGALETESGAELRAPLAEPARRSERARPFYVIAHPAAAVLAVFFRQLARAGRISRSVVHVFEPASERGRAGIDELQKQTTQLLSFRRLPQEVFDIQLSFNLLPAYGTEAPLSLEAVEQRISRHLDRLLQRIGSVPQPSIRLIQAPVFHGYSMSVWVEFGEPVEAAALREALAAERIEVRRPGEEPATNVGVSGQSGLAVSRVETDPRDARCAWFWIVADNHRVMAENAVGLARLLAAGEGTA